MTIPGPGEGETVSEPEQPASTSAEIYAGLANEVRQFTDRAPELVPSLSEQLERGQLTGRFTYDPGTKANMQSSSQTPETNVQMSEAEGVQQLQAFLRNFAETGQRGDEEDIKLAARAADLAENLTYIGTPELMHATATIAAGWKQHLDSDPRAGLYLWAQEYKSSQLIMEQALGQFTDDELEKYRGRLHFTQELRGYVPAGQERPQLSATDKVVMLDDWTASGRQLAKAFTEEIDVLPTVDGQQPQVEVQLIVASDQRLQDGLQASSVIGTETLPVHSVYRARTMAGGGESITGLHSSTDDAFEMPIAEMVTSLREKHGQTDAVMPPLTNIDRPYRQPDFATPNIDRMKETYGVAGPSSSY